MFKKFTLVALVACTAYSAFAQKPDWEKVEAVYTQLPSKPAAPMAKKYTMEVVMDADGIEANKAKDREALIQSITATNALLVKQGKPTQPYPKEEEVYYSIARDENSIKGALKLDGCQIVTAAPEFSVKMKISGFDMSATLITIEMTKAVAAVTAKPATATTPAVPARAAIPATYNYLYEARYSYKIAYVLSDASGSVVREEIIPGTDAVTTKRTKQFATVEALDYYWVSPECRTGFKSVCDNESYKKSLALANNVLNSELGYVVKTIKLNVATMKDAEVYADFITAFGDASMGYNYLSADKAKASDYILKAVAVWEKAAKEYNPAAKKQRVSDDVAGALYANLAVAYCFLEDWAQCNHNLVKLKAMDKGGKLKNKLEEADVFKADYEARAKANKVN